MDAKEKWIVGVQSLSSEIDGKSGWIQIAECRDRITAIEISDALRNLMKTGIVVNSAHGPGLTIRTHMSAGNH